MNERFLISKLTAKAKLTNKRTVDALEPEDKPWIAWHDKLKGFPVCASTPRPEVLRRKLPRWQRRAQGS